MSKKTEVEIKKLRIVIALLIISLAGIISVQIWYLVHAHRVKNETFQRNVDEALQQLVVKLENQEAYLFFKKDGTGGDTQSAPQKVKMLSPESLRPFAMKNNADFQAKDVLLAHEKMHSAERLADRAALYHNHKPFIGNIDSATLSLNDSNNDKEALANIKSPEQLRCYFKKKMTLNKMAFELAMRNKSIAQRMDLSQLDTLISNEFANESIDIPCKFGVVQASNDSIVYASKGADKTELTGSRYKAQLFPDDFFMKPHFLVVYFPERDLYLFKNIAILLGSSTTFLFIIVLLFFLMIKSFLEQKKLSDMKTDFINNMTHEFKTPITTISLASEALKDPDVNMDTGRLNRLAGMIWDENRRLETQVERVLQMARLDKGEVKLNKEPVNVNELVEDAISRVALLVEEREGVISCVCQANNPVIEADEFHFNNIMSNLLDNALKYSPGKPEIFVSTRNVNDKIEISVSDKGMGMTPDVQKRVFEKFYRVSTGNVHDVKGFGLGLAYVKNMVEAHGGTISLRSAPGKGSTFTILI